MMAALARTVRKMRAESVPLIDQAGLVIARLGPAIDKLHTFTDKAGPAVERAGEVFEAARRILEENRPRVAEISSDVAGMARTGREQVERLGELLQDAGDRARTRLDQIEGAMDSTVEHVEQAGDAVKRAILRPVREANGIAAGISAAVSTLMRGRKYSVDSATQDEEMFI
jgi:ABC-type transporter Mla subunit MlaD